uniref:Pleiotrophin/Midkine C-terminal domain-containing protein n=1 Tax=Aceria tosichella TaxID=561515 RepID=A0A6G1SDC5_9ACAR
MSIRKIEKNSRMQNKCIIIKPMTTAHKRRSHQRKSASVAEGRDRRLITKHGLLVTLLLGSIVGVELVVGDSTATTIQAEANGNNNNNITTTATTKAAIVLPKSSSDPIQKAPATTQSSSPSSSASSSNGISERIDSNSNGNSSRKPTSETAAGRPEKKVDKLYESKAQLVETTTTTTTTTKPDRLGWPKANSNNKKCDYDKGQWESCQPDGFQKKVMRLKAGDRADCKPTKTIRRDCRTGEVGCKYARGEWSSVCQNGQRVRIDTLVGLVEADGSEREPLYLFRANDEQPGPTTKLADGAAARCKPHRRVTKDCGRTCHYVKSEWSECSIDGFRTRVLTLEDSKPMTTDEQHKRGPDSGSDEDSGLKARPKRAVSTSAASDKPGAPVGGVPTTDAPAGAATSAAGGSGSKQRANGKRAGDNQICARQKLIRRECRVNSKLVPNNYGQLHQQQQQTNAQTVPNGAANMKQIQRRRLKQIQLKQSTAAAAAGAARPAPVAGLTVTTTTSTTPSTSTKPGGSPVTSQSVASLQPAVNKPARR